MKRKEKHVIDRIAKLRESIKRKYRQFKQGNMILEEKLEQKYKPLLKELKKSEMKTEIVPKKEPKVEFEPPAFSSPNQTLKHSTPPNLFLQEEDTFGDDDAETDVSSVLSTAEGLETASRYVEEQFSHPLTKKYMLEMMKDKGGRAHTIDHTYGPRFNNNELYVGDKPLTFDEDGSIMIADTRYRPTEGLYELIFKRIPDDEIYGAEDLQAYKSLLMKTSAHKKNYNSHSKINRNSSLKYRYVIQSLFPKDSYGGRGLMNKTVSESVPVYWDDPNELCDRLRLLVASAEAGNTGNRNEIISIIEELKEVGLIKGECNSKFKALLK